MHCIEKAQDVNYQSGLWRLATQSYDTLINMLRF